MALQPVQVFNATGEEPVKSYEYDAYGNTTVFNASGTELSESVIGTRYLFQGREYDSSTGLYYFRARWYDPDSGRWLSKDPIGIEGGLNQYVFCGNNPVNIVDPQGKFNIVVVTLVITVIVAVVSIISTGISQHELDQDIANLNEAGREAYDATSDYVDALNGNDIDAMIEAQAKRAEAVQGLVEPTCEAASQAMKMGTGSLGKEVIMKGF